jgi:hypothetical protein
MEGEAEEGSLVARVFITTQKPAQADEPRRASVLNGERRRWRQQRDNISKGENVNVY